MAKRQGDGGDNDDDDDFFYDDHRLDLQWKTAETQNSLGPWTATSFPGESLSDAWGLGSIPGTGTGLRHALANRQCDRQPGFCPQPPAPNPACRCSVDVGVQVLPEDRQVKRPAAVLPRMQGCKPQYSCGSPSSFSAHREFVSGRCSVSHDLSLSFIPFSLAIVHFCC